MSRKAEHPQTLQTHLYQINDPAVKAKLVGLMLDTRCSRKTTDERRGTRIEYPESGIWLICGVRMCINILSAAENAEFDFFSAVSAISAVNLSVFHLGLEHCHE